MTDNISTGIRLTLEDENNYSSVTDIYDSEYRYMRVVMKYIGDIETLAFVYSFKYKELIGGYAIITISRNNLIKLSTDSKVIWLERPDELFDFYKNSLSDVTSKIEYKAKSNKYGTGHGVIAAVLDSGCNFYREEFINNGSTVLEGYYDMASDTFYDRNDINTLINYKNSEIEPNGNIGSLSERNINYYHLDNTGHGTAVSYIIKNNAPDVRLLIVKLSFDPITARTDSAHLMEGIDFCIRYAIKGDYPMVINLSYGSNYGDHRGDTLLEDYLQFVLKLGRFNLICGSGNEGNKRIHASGEIAPYSSETKELSVSETQTGFMFSVYRKASESVDISLITPSNQVVNVSDLSKYIINARNDKQFIKAINGSATPYSEIKQTLFSLIPVDDYLEAGIWKINIRSKNVTDGRYDIYLPVSKSITGQVAFLNADIDNTLTVPSTLEKAITVGAYNKNTGTVASFSGKGYNIANVIKPEVIADGVDIIVPDNTEMGFMRVSGTSFSAPYITAYAACMMEWGIVNNNDPYLYGDKLKVKIISDAVRVNGFNVYPNQSSGYGLIR